MNPIVRRVTETAWFGPKRYAGWGWRPRTWQGLAVSVVLLAAMAADVRFVAHGALRYLGVAAIFMVWLLVMLLTGEGPGGPGL